MSDHGRLSEIRAKPREFACAQVSTNARMAGLAFNMHAKKRVDAATSSMEFAFREILRSRWMQGLMRGKQDDIGLRPVA